MPQHLPDTSCVVKVDGGRGFLIEYRFKILRVKLPRRLRLSKMRLPKFGTHRLVVTAAHCLPNLPPAQAASYTSERTYQNVLGPLNDKKNTVWAECLFADPVADIAVLGCPDAQEFGDQADAYHALTDGAPTLPIGKARSGRGWVLSLNGQWIPTTLAVFTGMGGAASLSIDPTEAGMSGSPILNKVGRAVGLVALGTETATAGGECRNERAGPQPILTYNLPGWLSGAT